MPSPGCSLKIAAIPAATTCRSSRPTGLKRSLAAAAVCLRYRPPMAAVFSGNSQRAKLASLVGAPVYYRAYMARRLTSTRPRPHSRANAAGRLFASHPGALSAAAQVETTSRSGAPSPQSFWGRPAAGAGRRSTLKSTLPASARVAAPTPGPIAQKPPPPVSPVPPRPGAPPASALRVWAAVCCPLRSPHPAAHPLRSERSGNAAPCVCRRGRLRASAAPRRQMRQLPAMLNADNSRRSLRSRRRNLTANGEAPTVASIFVMPLKMSALPHQQPRRHFQRPAEKQPNAIQPSAKRPKSGVIPD